MVEYFLLNILMKSMNSIYHKISEFGIKDNALKYMKLRKKSKTNMKSTEKVFLTSDYWTLNQTIGYMCLTVYCISSNWKFHSNIITFSDLDPTHTGGIIFEVISKNLLQQNLQNKVSTITLNNTSSNVVAARNLRVLFTRQSCSLILKDFFHVHCVVHILNLIIQDGLKEISKVIENVRESIFLIKWSPRCLYKFGEIAKQIRLSTIKTLCVNVLTYWNSTFKML